VFLVSPTVIEMLCAAGWEAAGSVFLNLKKKKKKRMLRDKKQEKYEINVINLF
jgi:hypothetical protein